MAITLRSAELEVLVTPERGGDIVQVTDRPTGTAVLAQSPTRHPRSIAASADSMASWMHGYPGGWQLLAPNAGPERIHDGVLQGYHGEAALARWEILGQDDHGCTLQTFLATAPLRLRREVVVDGPELAVTDTVENLSPDPASTRLLQHPAFGEPFLDADSYLLISAAHLISDAQAPGSLVSADLVAPPGNVLATGPVPGSLALPGPGSHESLFAALDGFETPSATFCSPTRGFAVRLDWDPVIYPHAWFWIEANAGTGWPWFRRMFAIAVEPANILPGDGVVGEYRRGGHGIELTGLSNLSTTTRMTRQSLPIVR